ncbi:hypothetical protein [Flavobacterium oreochromis]|uniref:DUF3828 domain-containing protein n=1 Tax=Flavobacterium oreochromis TaxID=2906078 RepID=A0ABW8PBF4_9FLAO|nr:hypothetical protein [Flavobacterium oreochromis]OWP74119.1 hypothetical protein BWG23_14935 [Flavobacterium oreochromis]
MKNIINLIIALFGNVVFAQVEIKQGIPLEYNDTKEVLFKVFKPALRINKAQKQSDIDYSKVEGLVQSYFSATDSIWDKSDYLDKSHKSVKDQEHYNSIKKSKIENEYIEIESVYEFTHNNQKRNYVKYAITIDGLPFQIVAVLSCVQVNKRWYIDNMFNQSNILSLISKLNSEKLALLFQAEKTNNDVVDAIKVKCSTNNLIDINLLFEFYQEESKNKESTLVKEIRDERNWIENYHYQKAKLSVIPTINVYKIQMPFSLDNAIFTVYNKIECELTNAPEIAEKLKNKVEKLLIPNTSEKVILIHKLKFTYNNLNCSLIKYKKNNKFFIENFTDLNKSNINVIPEALNNSILELKSSSIIELLSDAPKSKELETLRLQSLSNSENMINISNLSKLIKKNKLTLSKYLDN